MLRHTLSLSRLFTIKTLRKLAVSSNTGSALTSGRAYEIKKIHNRDPPPVEILERLTAKGADILTRTVENFKPAARLGAGSDSEDEGSKTPKEQKMDIDDPGSGSGRTTRGMQPLRPSGIRIWAFD